MSGWIKVEKDLETDPRVLRMAKALCNASALQDLQRRNASVTLVCGALARLWIYADSHIRDDDTLDMGAAEIDEWIGIPNFCSTMPADWLLQVDESTVELPGFQEHNGVEAKKRALTQKRVAQHRDNTKRISVTERNASALPDQTRPDQTKTRPESTRSARAPNPEVKGSFGQSEPEPEVHLHLEAIRAVYPRAPREDWITAMRYARQLVEDGEASWAQMTEAATRYAALCKATGRLVMNPANFFHASDRPWAQPWELPEMRAQPPPKGRYETAWDRIQAANGGSNETEDEHDRIIDVEPDAAALAPPGGALRG